MENKFEILKSEFEGWKDSVKKYAQLSRLHHQIKKAQRELEKEIKKENDAPHPFEDLFMYKKGDLA